MNYSTVRIIAFCLIISFLAACQEKPFINNENKEEEKENNRTEKYAQNLKAQNLIHLTKVKSTNELSSNTFPNQSMKDSLPYGELIYIPAYSEIYSIAHHRTELLSTTLSIHNVNLDRGFYITRLEYYDTDGKILKELRSNSLPMRVEKLATKNHVINFHEEEGGVGANFVLEWRSAEPIISPMIETIMISTESNWGLSFTSGSKVIKTYSKAK